MWLRLLRLSNFTPTRGTSYSLIRFAYKRIKSCYTTYMQDFTLQHANTFFFITTIAVVILILILLVMLYIAYRVFSFVRKTIARVDTALDAAAEEVETHPAYKKSLPYILPILGYVFGKKKKAHKKQ